ncbi:MAG: hypothetical protein CSA34_02485 [Desulfobulbus propionicus]|nr:MAG: hypothetical protein CSA34_02485 [Desulfobulbus propionicus]
MEAEQSGGGIGNPISALTRRLKIRGKLMLAFMVMIALTVVVIAISFISQRYSQAIINEVVQVQSRISRLSLATDRALKQMNALEKDFLLNYRQMGIQEAKVRYLQPMMKAGGETYRHLSEIRQIAPSPRELAAAQKTIKAINDYLAAFVATVDQLELRVDPEFGELVRLETSANALRDLVDKVKNPSLVGRFSVLFGLGQDYTALPSSTGAEVFLASAKALSGDLGVFELAGELQRDLQEALAEYVKWFTSVSETDKSIKERIAAYQKSVQATEPVIQAFLDNASADEQQALANLKKQQDNMQKILLGVGLAAIVLGVAISVGLARGLTKQVDRIMNLLAEIGMGNFTARAEVVSSDELGTMAVTLNAMLDNITQLIQSQEEREAIQESIITLMEEISALTEGDLTTRAEVTEDITGAIADSFNTMAEQFGDIVKQVKSATFAVDDTATDVTSRTADLAIKSLEQTEKINQAIRAVNAMAKSIDQISTNAVNSAEVSKTSRLSAHEGAKTVEHTNRAMEEIREQINETARSIKRLGESSMEIGNVVQIINDIADRTSILALNASIQAAMAGDAGHGFAVVAEEVQRLAESSSNSTKQIDMLVRSIQSEIKDVSNRMDESIGKVVQGSQLADNAFDKLQEIEKVSDRLDALIASITQAATDQVRSSEEIVVTMEEIGSVSKETSAASQKTASSMGMLNQTAGNLRKAVEMFRVESDTPL